MSNIDDIVDLAGLRATDNWTFGQIQAAMRLIRNRDLIHVDEVPDWLDAQDRDGGFDDAEVRRQQQTIDAAGMGGNGFTGAERAAHVLTVAARNGGA